MIIPVSPRKVAFFCEITAHLAFLTGVLASGDVEVEAMEITRVILGKQTDEMRKYLDDGDVATMPRMKMGFILLLRECLARLTNENAKD